jgi:polysaccharide export outer membrane protein
MNVPSIIAVQLFKLPAKLKSFLCLVMLASYLTGCSSFNALIGTTGPTGGQIKDMRDDPHLEGMQFVTVDAAVANKLKANRKKSLFSEAFINKVKSGYVFGAGDVIDISVWEAPPAMLFGPTTGGTSQMISFPAQMVNAKGNISMPFVGPILAAGLTPQQLEEKIVQELKDKANNPQVLVHVTNNNTANVTVVGAVATSTRIPLTSRGEKLLEVLAAAGGVTEAVDKISLQITRGNEVQTLAMTTLIENPRQNIVMQPGDVITAMIQPLTFTTMGALNKNQELFYEARGITLAQALGRIGGLDVETADARSVFIFRFEEPDALVWAKSPKLSVEGKVPVIYQVDMTDPANLFAAQQFPMANKDMLYISSAPATQFRKFIATIYQAVYMLKISMPSILN